ncbi:MAG: NAD-dependent epimerase/dehydratase family protein [Chloroflexota bacterium]|nr:MAG: NAD-dependent epimerase/dehydratase family protein [Chloroflexota bacterium]
MAHILVTGGAGFIGSHLAARLVSLGFSVRVLDKVSLPLDVQRKLGLSEFLARVEFQEGDVRHEDSVDKALRGVDTVFHLAARTSVEESMSHPEIHLSHNAVGTATLVKLARGRIERIILASSRAVYGEGSGSCGKCGEVFLLPREHSRLARKKWEPRCPNCAGPVSIMPCKEDLPLRPASIYGLSKQIQEDVVKRLLPGSESDWVILRYFNVYGEGYKGSSGSASVVNAFVRRALAARPFTIYEDGQQIRDFINIDDITAANVCALSAPSGTYNIGTGEKTTLRQLAEHIADCRDVRAVFEETGTSRRGDIRHSLANTDFAKSELRWAPKVDLSQGLKRLVNWTASSKGPK